MEPESPIVSGHDSGNIDAGREATDGLDWQRAEVPLAMVGMRLDQALAQMFPDYSRSRLSAWVRAGQVRVDDGACQPRQIVHGGEQVAVGVPSAPDESDRAQAMDLDIRYEDADILVINKPAGLVVHPGAGNPDGTLMNGLLAHDPALAGVPRAGIVHRLDKDTSGLMVVARSLPAQTALVAMLSRHAVARQYAAIVKGRLIAGDDVDAPLGRSSHDRLRQAVRVTGGKPAVTHYRVRERFRAHTLVQCNLETGRTHQIRVHMAHVGHGLVGDPLYGGGLKLARGASAEAVAALRGFKRQALHAERLGFTHPISGQRMQFEVACPADMQALIDVLRADADAA